MSSRRYVAALIALAAVALILLLAVPARAETRWIMCDDYVNVRSVPGKRGSVEGYLDAGDSFETDGKTRDGFIHVSGIGENGDGWAFKGYTVTEKPVLVNARYVCVAKNRVACRRWIGGPRRAWLYNGANVTVYWRTGEWSVTNKGYIRSEWLEPDPE